jgi:hypothetical protein
MVLPFLHGFKADASGDHLMAEMGLMVAVNLVALVLASSATMSWCTWNPIANKSYQIRTYWLVEVVTLVFKIVWAWCVRLEMSKIMLEGIPELYIRLQVSRFSP